MSKENVTRVGFDLRPLQEGFKAHKWRGIGVCTRHWAKRFGAAPSDLEIIPFCDASYEREEAMVYGAEPFRSGGLSKAIKAGAGEFVRQNSILGRDLNRFAAEKGLDCFYFPSHLDVPSGLNIPSIVTAHDMIYSAMRERFYGSFKQRMSVKTQIAALQKAERIIAVSEQSKKDVARYAAVDADKIRVVYNGVDEAFRPAPSAAIDRFALPKKFILNVGGIDWRKNVELLFSSFVRLLESDPAIHLVMTGDIEGDDRYHSFRAEMESGGLRDRVITPGFVSQEELIALYSRCLVFFYPSVYEGFGLPLLEAMACGAPVITTNRSSIPEVVGKAALRLDPDEPETFGASLIDLVANPSRRRELSEAGVIQAAKFSWARSATEIFATLAEWGNRRR